MAPKAEMSAEKCQQEGQSLDDLVMGTNSSSIVSKRSVEKLYHPHEPHFYRFFVPKFQRRAPLVNRGYHLRIKVIDTIVRNFLREPTSRKKVVVNLGCGSDVLPWQCNARYPELTRDTLFVDVDFPDLMERKRRVVLANPELSSLLGSSYSTGAEGSSILLQSDLYSLVACDLRQPSVLEECLTTILGSSTSEVSFLFVAEVSITYLETQAADEVIRWASTMGTAQFCLLEQMLPDGPGHPFATTMLNHFSKMNTPLRSVLQYPTLADQNQRFKARGWKSVESWPLWEAWADDWFMSAAERIHLDQTEPFDEWEEFALFGSHYLILHARSQVVDGSPPPTKGQYPPVVKWQTGMRLDHHPPGQSLRRFGAALKGTTPDGHDYLCHVLGQGPGSRLGSLDIHSVSGQSFPRGTLGLGPSPRVCHTLTDLGSAGVLLAGGRASPSAPLKECWLYNKSSGQWFRSHDLPSPLFRHSVIRLGSTSSALAMGGKMNKHDVAMGFYVFNPEVGWRTCATEGTPPAVFGATLIECPGIELGTHCGLLAGGMREDGTVNDTTFLWRLDMARSSQAQLSFRRCGDETPCSAGLHPIVHRFGASCLATSGGFYVLFGGVTAFGQLPQELDILVLKAGADGFKTVACLVDNDVSRSLRPFFVGSSIVSLGQDQFVVLGGGATCYGFGAYWSSGTYSIVLDSVGKPSATLQAPRSVQFAQISKIEPDQTTTVSTGTQDVSR